MERRKLRQRTPRLAFPASPASHPHAPFSSPAFAQSCLVSVPFSRLSRPLQHAHRPTGSTRIPFPNNIALDPDFRIDLVEPRTGAVGLRMGMVITIQGFRSDGPFCPPRSRTERNDSELLSPQLWSAFLRLQLRRISQYIQGLYTERGDLVPPTGLPPHAVHAFVSGCDTFASGPVRV